MTQQSPLKPLIWVGSTKRDFRALPDEAKSHMGYALYVAQLGGKHRDAKPLKGFGGAGVLEIVRDHRGDTFVRFIRCASQGRFTCFTYFRRNPRRAASCREPTKT